MAQENQLVVEISAKTVALVQGLATAENKLQEFGNTGVYTIEELNKALKVLKKSAEKSIDPDAIENFGRAYGDVTKKVEASKRIFNDAAKGLEQVNDSSKRARIAVYGLNQVVRDAPFGFIAISNNLPILFDQFGKLQTETGGTVNALKSFGKGLIGPAGISIAISAVIGVVTSLVQKYGSLGGAIDALIGKTSGLSDEQIKYSEKLASEIAEISVLVNAYPNLSGQRAEQEGILKKLNNIAPQYFKDLNTEKTNIDNLTAAYDNYLKSFVAKIFIEQQTKQLEEVAKSYTQELIKLLEKEKAVKEEQFKRINATKRQIALQERLAATNNKLTKGDIGLGVKILVQEPPKSIQDLIGELTNKFKKSAKDLFGAQADFFKALDFTGVFADDKNKNIKKATASTKEQNAQIKYTIDKLQEQKIALEGILNSASNITNSYADARIQIVKLDAEIKKLKNPKISAEIDANVANAIKDIENELKRNQFIAGKLRFENIEIDNEKLDKILKKDIPKKISAKNIDLNISPKVLKDIDAYNYQLSLLQFKYEALKPVIDAVTNSITNSIGGFIDKMIDGFDQGQTAMEAFQDTLKELGKTILKELAKLALLAGIRAISESLAPGSSSVTGRAAGIALGIGRAGGVARQGVNVGAGGLALAGQVTFVQRGQDLVGVLTKTNSRINRVG